MTEVVFISNARVAFPHIDRPHQATADSPMKYSADILLPMGDPQVQAVNQAAMAVATEKFKEHAQALLQMAASTPNLRSFGDGNHKVSTKTGQPLDGYAGNFFVSASNDMMPQIIQADGKPVDPANVMAAQAEARKVYGGCHVNVAVKPWPQDNQYGRTIRWELVAVQFAGDGEAFGSGAPIDASPMFKPVSAQPAAQSPAGMTQPMQANNPYASPQSPPTVAPVQGPDGLWRDPNGQVVAPPAMPNYQS